MIDGQDYYYVTKIKNVAKDGHHDVYAEYHYEVGATPRDVPGPDDDIEFDGFEGEFDGDGETESYVCSDVVCIDKGSRQESDLKKNMDKEPWERKAGGL